MLNSASIQEGVEALESYVEVADAFSQVASEWFEKDIYKLCANANLS